MIKKGRQHEANHKKKSRSLAARRIKVKTCIKCGSHEFTAAGACKPCKKAYSAMWREKNKEKEKIRLKEWRKNNIERAKATGLAWYEANKEKAIANAARWHKEKGIRKTRLIGRF